MNGTFISLESVSRWFGSGATLIRALSDISLTLEEGSRTALVGPSGSGKTTLLNLVGALDRPTKGKITIKEMVVSGFNEQQAADFRRNQVGFVFQDDSLFPELTLTENVALPLVLQGLSRAERRSRARELLTFLGLEMRLDSYPVNLSGGEKQRAAVARAVIHEPALLLADEPTANLDADAAEAVLQVIEQLAGRENLTVLVSTHDSRVFERFDRRIRLTDGRLVTQERSGSAR